MEMCANDFDATGERYMRPTAHDLDQIWGWNHQLPPTHSFCMHDKVTEQARNLRDKVAVSSWDGDLTYTQIEQYSTSVAHSLRYEGLKLHDVLPICFEKSAWTVVAVLAAMKAGATFVLMDPTLPLARLQNTAEQVGAKAILTSRKQYGLSASIVSGAKPFVVEADTFAVHSPNPQHEQSLLEVPSSALMYIIFTSGSTGVPKGVLISHETYSSSALPRAEAVGYTEESRVLDFASYAFDVSIDSMLLTLSHGGCLCIPSDEDRLNDINGVIRRMKVNYAGLTPSVARILDADVISSLTMLGLGGEAVTARDVNRWGEVTRIVIGYGPCECTIGCTINSSAATGRDYISIGRGNGASIWIVDPDDHELLVPVGTTGELLVEGPIVGQGYLYDAVKTEAAFINDPAWLVAGHHRYRGRRGRLYKSGDLVRYDPDGSGDIVFVGRKDTQVKLRGQRVELGEIEWQLRVLLPRDTNVIAEVIVPEKLRGQPMLVAFITTTSIKQQRNSDLPLELTEPADELHKALLKVDFELAKVLPRYMVPTAYIPVNHIPVLISGKTDRKTLRKFGATVDLQRSEKGAAETAAQGLSDLERRLQKAWSQTLGLEEESIRSHSNFFALGGDSVAAMRLISVCRGQGLELTVINVFRYPTLSAMAVLTQLRGEHVDVVVPAFSMVSQNIGDACSEAAQACGIDASMIEDIYPCTPGQESLFTFSIKSASPYVAQRLACIPDHINLDDWKSAWEKVVAATPILRSRIVQSGNSGLQQVVLSKDITWRYFKNLTQYLEQDRSERMDLGQNLARYAVIEDPSDGRRFMVWTIHHAVYDGWSEPLILKKVGMALRKQHFETPTQMKALVKHLRDLDEASVQDFWRRELDDAIGPQFPDLPHRDYMPTANTRRERRFGFKAAAGSPFTSATYIRGALSLVVSQYTGSDDVVLSETMTGREISLVGIESIEGPLITTLPVRTRINRASTVEAYLQTVQQSMAARTPYEHFGIQNIRRVSQDAQYACEARIGLVIQPKPEYTGDDLGFEQQDVVHEALKFNPYPLMLACQISGEDVKVCASFDDGLISVAQVERFLAQLETACSRLGETLDRRVGEMSCVSAAELDQIWQWNKRSPASFDEPSQRFRADASIEVGSVYPPVFVSWVCSPRNTSLLSPIGCVGELWLEAAFPYGEKIEAPKWLVAGSSQHPGRAATVLPTGDLVQLHEDGTLTFVGRKEDVLPVQGHGVNVRDLEAQLSKHLPSTVRAAAAVSEYSANDISHSPHHELVAFVQQQQQQQHDVDGDIHLLPTDHVVTTDVSEIEKHEMTVLAVASKDLVRQLNLLDKSLRNSLPPYMVPTVYVVVDRIPPSTDQSLLNGLASSIPLHVLNRLRSGLDEAWTISANQVELTSAERVLRKAWAKVLRMEETQIDLDDNFFRLGADSVLAMRLVSGLRAEGYILTVADIFQNMRLQDAARVLRVVQVSREEVKPYRAFSTLKNSELTAFLKGIVQPSLGNPAWPVQDVLPITDSQALDIKATIQTPRTSVQYNMLYFADDVEKQRLYRACEDLVRAHDILRTVFIEHDSRFLQVVLKEIDASVAAYKTEFDLREYVDGLCKQDIESRLDLGLPFLKLLHVEGRDGQSCLVIRLSHAQYDGVSLPVLLRDLEALYAGAKVADSEPFTKYISQVCDADIRTKANTYWRDLLNGSSLSVVTPVSASATGKSTFLEQPLDVSRRPKEITTANLISAAWALVLARRLETLDVTFGGITSGRQLDMGNADKVVGPCYQFTPIRVPFQSGWTALDLMHFVQKQSSKSVVHDFLGFDAISRHCTEWPAKAQFFDSVVHHQDFEDFDVMPFAGGSCRVDISNPHGDAAYPMKVASFLREGRLHVGVVGSEKERDLIEAVLEEVIAAVRDLVEQPSEPVSLSSPAAQTAESS